MNILVLDQFSDPGGAQQVLAELLPEMARRGWKGTVALPGEGELLERARTAGFATAPIALGPYASGRKSFAEAGRFLRDTLRAGRRIRILAEEIDADLIYVNGPRLVPAVAWARTGLPVVFHSHSYLDPGLSRYAVGLALTRMDAHVIGQCEFAAAPWRRFLGEDRIRVIYNGVAGPRHLRPRRMGGPPRIGCIGRIASEKGQREFIQAAAIMHQTLPECRFVIHGQALFGDPQAAAYADEMRREAGHLPIEFAGWTRDVYSAMAALDLLLVPSAGHEATTRVILEAFAAGLPVVAFASGGIPEVIENGVNGVLARDAADLAELAVLLLTGDPRRLISLSHSARESWERRFTLERCHSEVMRALESAAGVGIPVGLGR